MVEENGRVFSGIESKEGEKNRPKVIVVYGQHGISEEIAKTVAERLRHSSLKLRTNFTLVQHSEGLDYLDAYRAVTEKNKLGSKEFNQAFLEDMYSRVAKAHSLICELAKSNPDAVIIDIHDSLSGCKLFPIEGLALRTGLGWHENQKLEEMVREILPLRGKRRGKNFFGFGVFIAKDPKQGNIGIYPPNCVVLEIFVNPFLFEYLAAEEGVTEKALLGVRELRKVKFSKNGPEVATKFRVRIENEITKYTRILESVIPVIARYFQENIDFTDPKWIQTIQSF